MVEAMARGLPCIGTTVGGIPELLPAEDLVPPNNVPALAAKIKEVMADPRRMAGMTERNFSKAQEFQDEVLRERRIAFYTFVRQTTEQWLTACGRSCGTQDRPPQAIESACPQSAASTKRAPSPRAAKAAMVPPPLSE